MFLANPIYSNPIKPTNLLLLSSLLTQNRLCIPIKYPTFISFSLHPHQLSFKLPTDQSPDRKRKEKTKKTLDRKMANKLVSVFLMCIVVMATLHIRQAVADDGYKTCYEPCDEECKSEGNGDTFCEMKCDTDCLAKVAAGKFP